MSLHWWPSAATSAFLMSGLETVGLALYLLTRKRVVEALQTHAVIVEIGIAIAVIGIAAEATAMWGISRRQQPIAPLASHLSRLGTIIYVATSVLTGLIGFAPWLGGAVAVWVFQVPKIPEAVTFGLLGWASRGRGSSLQRLASIGLITIALIGCLSVVRIQLGWATEDMWPWLPSLHVSLRVAMWVLLGMWLRTTVHGNVQPATR